MLKLARIAAPKHKHQFKENYQMKNLELKELLELFDK
jgi:hypothetical protein